MLFDASNFHESLFKRNLCLVLFGCISSPSYLLCLSQLLILHPHNLKDFLVRSWVVCQLVPKWKNSSDWYALPLTNSKLRPPGSGNNHFFGATSMRQLPQPGSFFFSGIFGDWFSIQKFQVQGFTSHEYAHTKKVSQFLHGRNQISHPAEDLEAVTKATPPMTSSINGCHYKIFGPCEDRKKNGLTWPM